MFPGVMSGYVHDGIYLSLWICYLAANFTTKRLNFQGLELDTILLTKVILQRESKDFKLPLAGRAIATLAR